MFDDDESDDDEEDDTDDAYGGVEYVIPRVTTIQILLWIVVGVSLLFAAIEFVTMMEEPRGPTVFQQSVRETRFYACMGIAVLALAGNGVIGAVLAAGRGIATRVR